MTDIERALLDAVLADPGDDAPRLIMRTKLPVILGVFCVSEVVEDCLSG